MNFVLKLLKQKRKELQDDLMVCYPCQFVVGEGKRPRCGKHHKLLHSIKINKISHPARIPECNKREDRYVRNKIRQLDFAIKRLENDKGLFKGYVSFIGQQ